MNWNNLKKNKCPKCGKNLKFTTAKVGVIVDQVFTCSCDFYITASKFKKIVSGFVNKPTFEKHYRPDDEVPEVY